MRSYLYIFTTIIFLLFLFSCNDGSPGVDIYMTTDWGDLSGEKSTINNLQWTMTSCVIKIDLISTHIATSAQRA